MKQTAPLLFVLASVSAGCLNAPDPNASIRTAECRGVPGALIQAEFDVPCAELESQVQLARGLVPGGVKLEGVTITYRDADFLACEDQFCAMKALGYWHGETWPSPTIDLTRNGKLLLHELFHQTDAERLNTGAIGEDHDGWDVNGRNDADYKFRTTDALKL